MTIASDDNRKAGPYTCNGATVTFSFSFKVFAAATDLAVVLADSDGDETDLVYSTDYSVSLNSDQNANPGGTITTVSTYATGYFITILSDVPATQNTSIPSPSAFSPTVIEAAFDRLTALVLDARTSLARVLRGPRSDDDDIVVLPPAAQRANKTLYFDATGQPTVVNSTGDTSVSGAMEPVVTASTVDVGRAVLGADIAGMSNICFISSASAGALTISLKGDDGNDHSTGNPGYVAFRAGDGGDLTWHAITSALTITIPSTATLGAIANIPFRVWVVLCKRSAFSPRLGVINPLVISASFPADQNFEITPLAGWGQNLQYDELDTTSDTAGLFYEVGIDNNFIDLQYVVLGSVDFLGGLATPGTWIDGLDRKWIAGNPLPGQVVCTWGRRSAAVATGTTVLPIDDTIPQNTEGVQFMSAENTNGNSNDASPTCNLLRVSVDAELASSNTDNAIAGAIFVNTDANAIAAAIAARPATANVGCHLSLDYVGPNSDSAVGPIANVNFRAGTASAGTTTFNGSAATRRFGGRMSSQIVCQEIMT